MNGLIQKDELTEMKKINVATDIPISRLIDLKKKGYKIVRFKEVII